VFCLQKPSVVLPVEGAPVVFSTDYAHDVVLRVPNKSGRTMDLPLHADAAAGGFAVDARTLAAANMEDQVTGKVSGQWGFDSFDGPSFHLQNAHHAQWTLASNEQTALIVGREDSIHLRSDAAACVENITAKDEQRKTLKPAWTALSPGEVEVKLALKDESPGKLQIAVKQFGMAPDEITVKTYSESASLANLAIHAGDSQAVLTGTRLDEVASVDLSGIHFAPASLSRTDGKDVLNLSAEQGKDMSAIKAGEETTATVALKDGRTLNLQTAVAAARPKVTLINRTIQPGASAAVFHLGSDDELPQDGKLTFFVKSEQPEIFSREEKIEVATADSSYSVSLTFADGTLVAQDAHTAMGVLDPIKSLGAAAFGALRFRPVLAGTEGEWQPLAVLVRVPTLKEVHCSGNPDKQCTLSGSNLFLIDSVASDPQFERSVPVPTGFAEQIITVPRPNGTLLYLKLRDDPAAVNRAVLPVLPDQP
jgi:hypothetical protein